jgi:hypothetical protein
LTYFGNDYVLVIRKTSPYISYHLLGRSTVETLGPNQCAKQGSARRNWWLILSFHPPFTFVVRSFSCWVGVSPARKVVCTNLAICWFAVPLISLWLCGTLWNSLWNIWQFHMHFLSFCGVVWMGERAPWEAEKIHIVWNLLWKIGHTSEMLRCCVRIGHCFIRHPRSVHSSSARPTISSVRRDCSPRPVIWPSSNWVTRRAAPKVWGHCAITGENHLWNRNNGREGERERYIYIYSSRQKSSVFYPWEVCYTVELDEMSVWKMLQVSQFDPQNLSMVGPLVLGILRTLSAVIWHKDSICESIRCCQCIYIYIHNIW